MFVGYVCFISAYSVDADLRLLLHSAKVISHADIPLADLVCPSFPGYSNLALSPTSFSPHRCVGLRFHCRHAVLACVDSSNAFRLYDVPKRGLAECHDHVIFPKPPLGRGPWGGIGDVHPLSGVTFNPEDQTHSMLLFNHRQAEYNISEGGRGK